MIAGGVAAVIMRLFDAGSGLCIPGPIVRGMRMSRHPPRTAYQSDVRTGLFDVPDAVCFAVFDLHGSHRSAMPRRVHRAGR